MRSLRSRSTSSSAATQPPSRYTAAITASIASDRIDGFARPPDASSPLPSNITAPRSSSSASSASASAFTTDARELRELAFGELRVLDVDVIGDAEAEHRVAEELHALVGLRVGVLGAVRPVDERGIEVPTIDELVAERGLEPVEIVGAGHVAPATLVRAIT